jgi:hypothetical protein
VLELSAAKKILQMKPAVGVVETPLNTTATGAEKLQSTKG